MDFETRKLIDRHRGTPFPELWLGRALYVHLLSREKALIQAGELAKRVRSAMKEAGCYDLPHGGTAEGMGVERAFDSLVWDGFICHALDGYVQMVDWGSVSPAQHMVHFVAAARAGAVDAEMSPEDVVEWLNRTASARVEFANENRKA